MYFSKADSSCKEKGIDINKEKHVCISHLMAEWEISLKALAQCGSLRTGLQVTQNLLLAS